MRGLSFAAATYEDCLMVATAAPSRSFVPVEFNPAEWSQAEPLYRALLEQPVNSPAELKRWLTDFSELSSVMDEYGSRRYIDKSCHTDDEAIQGRYLQFVEEIEPKIKPPHFQ